MLAYNTAWINVLETSREAKRWMESRLISSEQYSAIKSAYTTPLYTPNLFIRIALYIFTAICLSGVTGFSTLIFSSAGTESISGIFLFLGIVTVIVLEVLIRTKHLYCAGIDDAMLYAALGLCIGGILGLFFFHDSDWELIVPPLIALPFLVVASIRYADRLTTLAGYGCILFVVGKLMVDRGGIIEALVPFAVMVISLGVLVGCLSLRKQIDLEPWQKCLTVLEIASLVTFYLGGNYLVVRQLTELLLKFEIPEGGDIPFAYLFYALTILIPAAYIILGIRRRESNLLRVGLLAVAFSAYTFRYYFHIAPPEIALTAGGMVLILAAVLTIRYLKTPKNGITHNKVMSRKFENLDTEMLIVSQTLGAPTSQSQPGQDFKPGGGGFGGGGTSGDW